MAIEEFYASITGNADGLIRAAGEGEAAAGSLESRMGAVNGGMSSLGTKGAAAVRGSTKEVSLLDKAFGGVFGSIKGVIGGMVGMIGQTAGIGALFGGAVGLVQGVKYAQDYNEQMALINAAYATMGKTVPTTQINSMLASMQKLGFAESDSLPALVGLAQAHIPVSEQMQVMSTAADLARAKNISLASAEDLLLKATTGTGRGLQDLGIILPAVIPKSLALQSATAAMTKAQALYNLDLDKYGAASSKTITAHTALAAATVKVSTDTKEMKNQFAALPQTLAQVESRVAGSAASYKNANPFATMGADLQSIARVGGQALLPFLDQLAGTVQKNEPAIESFVKNGVQFLATAAKDAGSFIANDLYPPVKDVIGFLVQNKGVVEGVVASLTGLYVVKKGVSAAGSVLGDLKELFGGKGVVLNAVHALTGLGSGGSSSSGLVGGLKPVNVYVTNWEQMGGGGPGGINPTDVAKNGGLVAIAATAATTALAAAGMLVVIGDVALAFNKGKGTGAQSSTRGELDPGYARFGNLQSQQNDALQTNIGVIQSAAAQTKADQANFDKAFGLATTNAYGLAANIKGAGNQVLAMVSTFASTVLGDSNAVASNLGRQAAQLSRSLGGGSPAPITIHIHGVTDPQAAAVATRNELLMLQRRGALNSGLLVR